MKEYYLVPTHEIDNPQLNKVPVNDNTKDRQLFSSDQISKSDIIEIHNQLNKIRREYEKGAFTRPSLEGKVLASEEDKVIGETVPSLESEENRGNTLDKTMTNVMSIVPKDASESAKRFINVITVNKILEFDQEGNVTLPSSRRKIPLKDFIRGVFVGNAKVKHIKDFLKELFHNLGLILNSDGFEFIRNKKLIDLLKVKPESDSLIEEQTLSDIDTSFKSPLKGGNLRKKDSIPWIIM